MECAELQEEEREVLVSIYESDESFKQVDDTTYTYKVDEEGASSSFLLQISWGENYPNNLPELSLDAFYNNHLNQESKKAILSALTQEAEGLLESPMTYSLFEFARENGPGLVTVQPDTYNATESPAAAAAQPVKVKKERKEVLSKAAKRKMADRLNADGELPRGWNWVDIIKHLSRTGGSSQSC